MKTCLIAPIPDLDRFVGREHTHHLLLEHLFDAPGWGDTYREFYMRRSRAGDFIILDNGAKEHARGAGLAQLLRRAREVEADEIVVSDIRFKGRESLALSTSEMYALRDHLSEEYSAAGKPQLMLVPHGETIIDWRNCMLGLELVAEEILADLDGPQFTLGIPYAYAHTFPDGEYMQMIRAAIYRVTERNVHLLGWPRQLELLAAVSDEYPDIRSIDSSRPFVYAREEMYSVPGQEYPGRTKAFFTSPTPWTCEEYAWENIKIFRALAADR